MYNNFWYTDTYTGEIYVGYIWEKLDYIYCFLLLLIVRFPRTVLFAFQILSHSVQRSARNWKYFGGNSVPFKRPCPSFRDRAFGAFPPLFRPPRKAFGTSAGAPMDRWKIVRWVWWVRAKSESFPFRSAVLCLCIWYERRNGLYEWSYKNKLAKNIFTMFVWEAMLQNNYIVEWSRTFLVLMSKSRMCFWEKGLKSWKNPIFGHLWIVILL